LEQRHPQIEERLTSTLQLAALLDKKSSAFVEAIATQAHSGMASCSEESLAGQSVRKAIVIAAICTGIFALGLLLAPERLIPSLANVLRPWHDRLLPRLTAQVIPGHAEIAEGADIEIKVAGLDKKSAVLEILSDVEGSSRNQIRDSHSMVLDPQKLEAGFLLQHIRESLAYRIRSEGLYSDIFQVTVHPAPVITDLKATMTFPPYTQLPPETLDLLPPRTTSDTAPVPPVITALPGTRITVTGTSSLPISEAAMQRDAATIAGKLAAEAAKCTWEFDVNSIPAETQTARQHCSVTITSDHQVSSEPTRFEIHVGKDLAPTVEIEGLDADTLTVQPDQSLEIPFSVVDDFGIRKVELAVRKGVQEPSLTIIPTVEAGKPGVDVDMQQCDGSTILDLAALNVKPGDTLSVWLRASDNRIEPLGGPQSTDSRIITLHVAENAAPVGQQAVQQQHENAQQELRTAIDHIKKAQSNVRQASESLHPQIEDPAPKPPQGIPNPDATTDPQSADKFAADAREKIQLAQQALQRMQDRIHEQKSSVFQSEIEQAQQVSQQELKQAEQQSSLIPLSDDLKQKQEAANDAARELEQAIRKLEQIQSDIAKRSQEMELAAQLDDLAKQQEKLAQRMKEEQPATAREPSKEAQQQKDIADDLQKLAASNENARSELFRQRAEEAARFAEETQRLQERQEQLNQVKDHRDQPVEKREQQLKEIIAKEQESINRQTRELDQSPKESQTDEERDALTKQQERVRDAMQAVQETRPEDAVKKLQEQIADRTEQVRQKADELLTRPSDDEENRAEMKAAQEKLQRAAEQTKAANEEANDQQPQKQQDNQKPNNQQPNNQQPNNQQPNDQQPNNQQPNNQQPNNQQPNNQQPNNQQPNNQQPNNQQPNNQQPNNQQPNNQQPNNQQPNNQQPNNQQPNNQQPNKQQPNNQQPNDQQPNDQQPNNGAQKANNDAPPKPAKAIEEATRALLSVCKSCQSCAQCKNPGGSPGSSGSQPRDGAPGESREGKQLANAAEKASQTAKRPDAKGVEELSRDLNQLADQAAERSQFPGRKRKGAEGRQADQIAKPGSDSETTPDGSSATKAGSNTKPGGKGNQPAGATGKDQSSDQLDSPKQLRGPSTSNWTRSRRMLNGSVLDDRDAKVPQEYRGVVEDYFEQLSRIESRDAGVAAGPAKAAPDADEEREK
jgi:hypothetical protein